VVRVPDAGIFFLPGQYFKKKGPVIVEVLTFKKCKKEDLPRISDFRKNFYSSGEENPNRSHESEYYEWKLFRNPVRPGEMWFAETDDKIVGMKSMTPKRIKILDTIFDGAETGDNFVHPDFQRRGIFTGLYLAARENSPDESRGFIYGLPNTMAITGYLNKLDYARIPIRIRGLVKPVCTKQLFRKVISPPVLAGILSPAVEITSRFMYRIGSGGIPESGITVNTETSFPDGMDMLWKKTLKNYDVMVARNRDYLEWRYVTNPDKYSIYIARNAEGAISGYMVAKAGTYSDVPVGFIVDFLTVEDDPNVFRKLLAAAMDDFYHQKVSIVSTCAIKGNFYDKLLLKSGFFPRGNHNIICYKNEIGNRVLTGNYRWHFTLGDSDNI
jgi:GNAT superfamily N-acetyltransferase